MILRLESSYVQMVNKLGRPFSEDSKKGLAKSIENNYNKICNAMAFQEELKEEYKPSVVELGKIGERFFALNIYYRIDETGDDIPLAIKELLPSQPPVRIDIVARISDSIGNTQDNYLKVGEVYDDGDIHSHYLKDVKLADQGLRPIDEK
jgi:hypothetical protein